MCLTIKKSSITLEAETAAADITCFKELRIKWNKKTKQDEFFSPTRQTPPVKWAIGVLKSVTDMKLSVKLDNYGEAAIHKGLHAHQKSRDVYDGTAIFKAVIPKGARYWKGSDGDICADKMKIVERVG